MEGEHHGRWFALNEDGTRLVIETAMFGQTCYVGTTTDDAFTGEPAGVLKTARKALAWMFESDPTLEPWPIDRKKRTPITVSIAETETPTQESATC